MFEPKHAHDGISLAAPQIALSLRIFVVECTDQETGKHCKVAIANPEILKAEGEQRLQKKNPGSGSAAAWIGDIIPHGLFVQS